MDTKPFIVDVAHLGVKNTNGRLYSRELMDKAITALEGRPLLGKVVVVDVEKTRTVTDPLNRLDAAFEAVLSIEGDMLKATVTPIDTPAGRSVAEFVEAMGGPGRLRGALAGVGNVKEVDGAMVVQDDYRITSVGLLLKEHWGGGRDPGTEEGPPAGEAVK